MNEDEELYREMNKDDYYYMGDRGGFNDKDEDNSPDERDFSSNRGCTGVFMGIILLIYMLF